MLHDGPHFIHTCESGMEALPLNFMRGGVGGVELLCVGCWLTENDEALRSICSYRAFGVLRPHSLVA